MQANALKSRCLKGDEDAWRDLYREFYGQAEAIARAYPFQLPAQEAEDIAQDTMIELTKKLAGIDNVRGFVGVVAHNKCVDRVRKKKPVLESALPQDGAGNSVLDRASAPEPLPFDAAENFALVELSNAMEALGEPCRKLLFFRFFEELSYENVAERSSIPVQQIGVYLSRCLLRLRANLQSSPEIWGELSALL